MDDSGHSEIGRHKADQYKSIHTQWMMPHHQMKDTHTHTFKFMAVMAERDKAIQECNTALSEKKTALAERDIAILQRDAAIAERNTAIMERDNAVASLEYTRENGMNATSGPGCPPGCSATHLTKHVNHHQQQYRQHAQSQPPQLSDAPYNTTREMHTTEAFPITAVSEGVVKVRKAKRQKETKTRTAPPKKISKSPRKNKRGRGDDLNKQVTVMKPQSEWRGEVEGGEDPNKQVSVKKHNEWKDQDLGLNLVAFDESMMQIPVCSCTGKYRQCYKWGNGGWQSACCTTMLSIYPLPVVPNKRHARLGGRKMSGSAFSKLLSRLAAEGHDLSKPLDLKDHWSKHGTNRYITIK